MADKLTPERAVRLLRAKAAELEQQVLDEANAHGGVRRPVTLLAADIALVADILANHIEKHIVDETPMFNDDGTPWRPDQAWLQQARESGEITEEQYQGWRDR